MINDPKIGEGRDSSYFNSIGDKHPDYCPTRSLKVKAVQIQLMGFGQGLQQGKEAKVALCVGPFKHFNMPLFFCFYF